MSTLLVWRERLQKVYAAYSIYILKGLQFILGLLVFGLINANVGYMEMASSVFCTLGLAVFCTFFPMIVMVLAAAALILVHFYALSIPITIVSLLIFLLMYIFYFRFTPKKAWLLLASALAFALHIPFVLPIVFGLLGTPVWIVPAACGIITYYMAAFVKTSTTVLQGADADGMVTGLMNFARQVVTNREMWLMVLSVSLGILVVNLIRTRPVEHAWKIASAAGACVCVIVTAAGNIALGTHVSYVSTIVSSVLGAFVGIVLEFFFFSVDYSRTENIQFEDDEYYYYVKAVPKVGVPVPEKKVKHITEQSGKETPAGVKKEEPDDADSEKNTEEILLTRSLSKELGLDQNQDLRE
ncbi:hypothetical protein B5F07_00605 [Lachnoclostridium sp. An169]|uniref:MARVEL domain-containing protein n=1 Tax=Lachnoclostridium sp. An169 TaxID=1965569 RepID=UPI000B39BB21|nr:MARVEL domain-containing protein [Lachnoclostridium sp. An169]OUP86525.1 hypothetical protein B5F07_00605 [Lachnoclostridium sp. An169]HJA65295.1 MARVEL domain-containing protein [Candidatus Mediterraneibacter cottocaccae]